jgi:hypothetical protein
MNEYKRCLRSRADHGSVDPLAAEVTFFVYVQSMIK